MKQHVVEEIHGGVKLNHSYYNLIAFYYPDKFVGLYSGSKLWTKPFEDKSFRYFGELTNVNDAEIEFYINDRPNDDVIFFKGLLMDDRIEIVAKRKSNPEVTWLDDVFEFIGEG